MTARSGKARVAFAGFATAATILFCSATVLMTSACGIRVSSSDFPVFRLSEPEAASRPVADAGAAGTRSN